MLLLALSGGTALGAGAPPDARSLIHDCVLRASPTLQGIEALRADCPHLAAALHDLRVDAFLPQDWPKHLNTRQLADVDALLTRYAGTPPRAPPSPASLQEIARHLPVPPAPPPSWWDVLERWVSSWLDRHLSDSWLSGWKLTSLGRSALLLGLIATVLVGAGIIVFIELRASGVLDARERRTRPPGIQPSASPAESVDPTDLANVPLRLRPVLLLRSLVAVLARAERLGHERDLTCRELITAARFDTSSQRERFARIALLAEEALYSDPGHHFSQPLTEDAIADARGLAGQLRAAPQEQHASA